MARHQKTKILKRTGDALLGNGTLKRYKFSYNEPRALKGGEAFDYFFDCETNKKIPKNIIAAAKFSVGLDHQEQETFCRGLAKMSIGALAYLLTKDGIQSNNIKKRFSQISIDSIRHFALKLPWLGNSISHRFSLGRTDVLSRLQYSSKNPKISNHIIEVNFLKRNLIRIEGMLFSKHGWQLDLPNSVFMDLGILRLENPLSEMSAPDSLRDLTLSPDSICIINPHYEGQKPTIPQSWRNRQ